MLIAVGLCALVFGGAVYLELEDASTTVRVVILAAMVAVTALMLWAVAGDHGGGE